MANLNLNDAETTQTSQTSQTEKISTSKFSFSKLSKFVSKSALKVIGSARKSYGSSSSSNPSDTSMNSDDEDEEETPTKENLNINLVKLLNEEAETRHCFMNSPKMGANRKLRPTMGLTAAMLKRYKNNNGNYTTYCVPNYFLVGLPIVFNSSNLNQEEKCVSISKPIARNKTTSSLEQMGNNYDHLTRVRDNTPKKKQSSTGKISVFNGTKTYSMSSSSLAQTQAPHLQTHTFESIVF